MSTSHNAILGRLQHADWKIIGQTLEEALETDCRRDAISLIIERRIASGTYVINKPLARLIVEGRSSSLYDKVRDQLGSDVWSLITLYQGKYPDPKIEEKLCNDLYKIALNDAEPARVYIVDAMRDVASPNVLPTLEALASDLAPSAKVLEVFSEQLDPLGAMQANARIKFAMRLATAIDNIRLRQEDSSFDLPSFISSGSDGKEQDLLIVYRLKAQSYLDTEPENSINWIRKGAEAIGKRWYRALIADKKGVPARKMQLEELIKNLRELKAPDMLIHYLVTLQPLTNYGSHDQDGEQTINLTKDVVSPLLAIYGQAVAFHQRFASSDPRFSDGS